MTTGKEWRRPELNCTVPAHDQSQDERRRGQKANQLVATGYQCIKKGDWGGEETSLLCMATVETIMYFVYWVPREKRLNGWVARWDRGLHYGLHFGVRTPFCSGSFLSRGAGCHLGCSFSGQGESGREDTHHWPCAEAWRGYRVMPHTHTCTKALSKRSCQPPR